MADYKAGMVKDEDLRKISIEISKDGDFIGRSLGVKDGDIQIFREDYPRNCREKNYQILKKWKECGGVRKATYKCLGAAFLKCDRRDLQEKYCINKTVKEKPAGNRQQRKRPRSQSSERTDHPKKQKKTTINNTTVKGTKPTEKKSTENVKKGKTAPSKKQKKGPVSKVAAPAKGKVGGQKTGQNLSNRSQGTKVRIIDVVEKGYPKGNPVTKKWFRGKYAAADDSNWYHIAIWDDPGKEQLNLFKKRNCLVLKGVSVKGNDISFGQSSKAEMCGTAINPGKDVLRKMEKYEKKSFQTLQQIRQSGKPSKTKLRLRKVGECEIKNGVRFRKLIVRNKGSEEEHEVVLFGDNARRKTLKEGQTIVLYVQYNSERKNFKTEGNFVMKILKSKKGKSKRKKKKSSQKST